MTNSVPHAKEAPGGRHGSAATPTFIEVILTNGDRAEATTPEGALVAALTLMDDASARSAYAMRGLTASFLVDGRLVREGVRRATLSERGLS